LALAIFVVVSGQVRAFDAFDTSPDGNEDEVTFSVLDDGFVALPGSTAVPPGIAPVTPLLFALPPPSGRLVVPDLFRPPIRLLLV
jgi:hypothetical protein